MKFHHLRLTWSNCISYLAITVLYTAYQFKFYRLKKDFETLRSMLRELFQTNRNEIGQNGIGQNLLQNSAMVYQRQIKNESMSMYVANQLSMGI